MTTTTMTIEARDHALAILARAAGFTLFPELAVGTHPSHALQALEAQVPHFTHLRRFGGRVVLHELRVWGGRTLAAVAYAVHSTACCEWSEAAIIDCRGTVLRSTRSPFARGGNAIEQFEQLISEVAACPTANLITALDDEIVAKEGALSKLYSVQVQMRRLNELEQKSRAVDTEPAP